MMVQASITSLTVCVVGLGYVGHPLAVAFSRHLRTIGYDLDMNKITEINAESGNRVLATTDPTRIAEADVVIIAAPTPVTKAKDPDISYVFSAAETVGRNLKDGAIVVLESTVYPGLTEEVMIPTLERVSRKSCGKDFFVGYSPERINPGSNDHEFIQRPLSLIKDRNGNITLISPEYNAAEMKWIISQMVSFVGARAHSTIAALSSGVPTLSFAYSIKAKGINRDIIGHTNYCMDPGNLDAEAVADRATSMLDENAVIRNDLAEKIPAAQREALSAGVGLKDIIKVN